MLICYVSFRFQWWPKWQALAPAHSWIIINITVIMTETDCAAAAAAAADDDDDDDDDDYI